MVARKLRFESLELRRLFAIDLELKSEPPADPGNQLYSITAEESPTPGSEAQIVTLTGDYSALSAAFPLITSNSDRMGSPFLVETEQHLLVARPNYSNRTTDLHILTRQDDGTSAETAILNVDLQVERLFRLGNNIVVFGSQYQSAPTPDLRFGGSIHSQVLVVDPNSQEVIYEASLEGSVIQAIELPTGIAFETAPHYTLAATTLAEPTPDAPSEVPEVISETITTDAIAVEPAYQLGYLYLTEDGIGLTQSEVDEPSTIAYFGGSIINISALSSTDPAASHYALRRWNVSATELEPIDSIELSHITSGWEYLHSFEVSPSGSQLLVLRASQDLIEEKTWNQKLTLDWLTHSDNGTTLTGTYTLDSFIGSARWINENQILLLSYDAPAEVAILDISDASQPKLSKIALSQRLQLNHVLPIGEGHVALIGFTPVTPFPIDDSIERRPDFIPMVVTDPSHGAIVILDLQQQKITDEQLFGPNTMLDQPLPVATPANHFAYRSLTTNPDWSYTESLHLSTIDEQGKLVNVAELSLGSNWNYQQANDSTVTIVSSDYMEERAWQDLSQSIWRVHFEPQTEEIPPILPPIDPIVPREYMRGEFTEEIVITGTVPADIPMDTNGDGIISPIDVLQVINYINRAYTEDNADELLIISADDVTRFDFDGDSKILPTDVMMMIASLNVVHETFESLDDVSVTPELPEEPCFWDMLIEEQELPDEMIAASIEALFGDLLESPETSFAGDFWNWFAPMDPWADRFKQQWIVIDPPLES